VAAGRAPRNRHGVAAPPPVAPPCSSQSRRRPGQHGRHGRHGVASAWGRSRRTSVAARVVMMFDRLCVVSAVGQRTRTTIRHLWAPRPANSDPPARMPLSIAEGCPSHRTTSPGAGSSPGSEASGPRSPELVGVFVSAPACRAGWPSKATNGPRPPLREPRSTGQRSNPDHFHRRERHPGAGGGSRSQVCPTR
jgi:hypothetical protein